MNARRTRKRSLAEHDSTAGIEIEPAVGSVRSQESREAEPGDDSGEQRGERRLEGEREGGERRDADGAWQRRVDRVHPGGRDLRVGG